MYFCNAKNCFDFALWIVEIFWRFETNELKKQ